MQQKTLASAKLIVPQQSRDGLVGLMNKLFVVWRSSDKSCLFRNILYHWWWESCPLEQQTPTGIWLHLALALCIIFLFAPSMCPMTQSTFRWQINWMHNVGAKNDNLWITPVLHEDFFIRYVALCVTITGCFPGHFFPSTPLCGYPSYFFTYFRKPVFGHSYSPTLLILNNCEMICQNIRIIENDIITG